MSNSTCESLNTETVRTQRFSTLQLAFVLVALAVLAVTVGVPLEHVSAFGTLSNHPVNPPCKSC